MESCADVSSISSIDLSSHDRADLGCRRNANRKIRSACKCWSDLYSRLLFLGSRESNVIGQGCTLTAAATSYRQDSVKLPLSLVSMHFEFMLSSWAVSSRPSWPFTLTQDTILARINDAGNRGIPKLCSCLLVHLFTFTTSMKPYNSRPFTSSRVAVITV